MKKTILTMMLTLMMGVLGSTTAYAHDESSDEKSGDDKSGEETSTVTVTADDFDITTTADDYIVTFLRADGTPMANVSVTVKNSLSGADGDISRDEYTTDENGIFDYSPFLGDDVQILRITDSESGNSLEYSITSGELSIEAGKNKSDDGGQSTSKTKTYMLIGGAAAIVVIGVVTAVVVVKQKKKKAAFAEKAGKKAVKKK